MVVDIVEAERWRRHVLRAVVVADEIDGLILEGLDLEAVGERVEREVVIQ